MLNNCNLIKLRLIKLLVINQLKKLPFISGLIDQADYFSDNRPLGNHQELYQISIHHDHFFLKYKLLC